MIFGPSGECKTCLLKYLTKTTNDTKSQSRWQKRS